MPPAPREGTIELNPLALLTSASVPVRLTVVLLVAASTAVWVIAVLKFLQLARLRAAERGFEEGARRLATGAELCAFAESNLASPGGRVVREIGARAASAGVERLRAIADRAIVSERQNASTLMSTLGSIAAASPFVGLFGTVYGIMDAFVRIGAEKSASLPVVAPAIGEALITTAIGLAAAIPAVVFYNAIDRRIGDLVAELEASAAEWVLLVGEGEGHGAVPLTRVSSRPPPPPALPARDARRR